MNPKLSTSLKLHVSKKFRLEDINEALSYYKNNMSKGKILLLPQIREKINN